MGSLINLTGKRFGRLSVTGQAESLERKTRWNCTCDCGTEKVIDGASLRRGETVSCGCRRSEALAAGHLIHGMTDHPLYRTWKNMKRRCTDAKSKDYPNYGGRGIQVCERWMNSLPNFVADMDEKPGPQYSIDRIDNDGNYEPDNVRWATRQQQNANQRQRTHCDDGHESTPLVVFSNGAKRCRVCRARKQRAYRASAKR